MATRRTLLALGTAALLPAARARAQAPKLEDALVVRTTGGVFEAALKKIMGKYVSMANLLDPRGTFPLLHQYQESKLTAIR